MEPKRILYGSLCFIILLSGCGKNPGQENEVSSGALNQKNQHSAAETVQENSFEPFLVYSDKGTRGNHYTPSGFMPDGKCLQFNDVWTTGCASGNTCIRVDYDVACSKQGAKWAGIFWLNPPNNWGSRKGGYDLTGAKKLTFFAKGEKGGEHIKEFTIGGITGDYPDSDSALIADIILGSDWKQYSIDLRGKDLSFISGGFAWSTSVDVNPENCVFYLDEIKYE